MSNLYKSAMQARLAKLPHPDQLPQIPTTYPGHAFGADIQEEDDESEETDSLGSLPPGGGMGPPARPANTPRSSRRSRMRKPHTPNPEFAPISAAGYFKEALQVSVHPRGLDFRVYHTPPTTAKGAKGAVMMCHHGAGYTGLSFACFAKEVEALSKGECGVMTFDARRHGKTTSLNGEEDQDLSIGVLIDDFVELIKTIFPDTTTGPTLLFVGHSMGGSVVVQSCPKLQDLGYRVAGVAVLDVVEGSAIEALPHMHSLLNARPDGFEGLEEAIEWHVTTNTIRNPTSARVSIPSLFKHIPESEILPPYQWRTPLRSTAPYWSSWFTSLSSKFLAARTARILILAGTDRLDKELMIGQMQGKFQQVVVPGVGHMLHEDDPTRLAETLVEFWRRNDRVVVGIKKVGEL